MTRILCAVMVVVGAVMATPAWAQLGQLGKAKSAIDKGQKAADAVNSLIFTAAEEQQLGQQVSDKLRVRYGVVQDKAVHKYVTLVGSALAQVSGQPAVPWKFIVLDTDGVNAYAAPGGFIHITRGALSLLQNESELAGMLAHEIAHVTQKHTINAIKKSNGEKILTDLGGQATRSQFIGAFADKLYENVFQGVYDRGDELDADDKGAAFANKAGYSPAGLGAFLTRLDERNKDQPERNGLFASHPDTKERIDKLAKGITTHKLSATAVVAGRYKTSITYKPVPVTQVAQVTNSKLGMSSQTAIGTEKKSSSTVASAGARGGVPDRDAKGGPNPAVVVVTVTAAEIADFIKGITG